MSMAHKHTHKPGMGNLQKKGPTFYPWLVFTLFRCFASGSGMAKPGLAHPVAFREKRERERAGPFSQRDERGRVAFLGLVTVL